MQPLDRWKELDFAVILAAIHAQGTGRAHSVHDPRMHATLARLEELFDASYPINRGRGPERGPAMGRRRTALRAASCLELCGLHFVHRRAQRRAAARTAAPGLAAATRQETI
jgi:hypothetical protein